MRLNLTRILPSFITAAIAAGLLALFFYLAVVVFGTATKPPLLADVVPTAAPTPGPDGNFPPQFRGSFDPNARGLAVLAIVSPLLTTVVGFYFGQRSGEAGKDAVVAGAAADKAVIKTTLSTEPDSSKALATLHDRGILPR